MTTPIHFDLNTQRDEWLAWREGKITATRITALTGESGFAGPRSIYLELTGQAPEKKVTPAMLFGSLAEEYVAQAWGHRHGRTVESAGCWTHIDNNRLVTSTDWRSGETLLEIKTGFEVWPEGEPPAAYVTQTIWEMGILRQCGAGINEALIVLAPTGMGNLANVQTIALAAHGNSDPVADLVIYEYPVAWDPQRFDELVDIANQFLSMIDQGMMPKPNGADLAVLACESDSTSIDLTAEQWDALLEYDRCSEAAKRLYKERDNHKAVVLDALGQAAAGIWEGRKVVSYEANKNGVRSLRVDGIKAQPAATPPVPVEEAEIPSQIRERLAAIAQNPIRKQYAVDNWPETLPAKITAPGWTAPNVATLGRFVAAVEQHFGEPQFDPAPQAVIGLLDDGDPVDAEIIQSARKRLAKLDKACTDRFVDWLDESTDAERSFKPQATPLRRQATITSLAIDILERYGVEDDALVRAILRVAYTEDEVQTSVTIGCALGSLTIEQAQHLRDVLPQLASLGLVFTDDETAHFAGAERLHLAATAA